MSTPNQFHLVTVVALSLAAAFGSLCGSAATLDEQIASLQKQATHGPTHPRALIKLGESLMQKSRHTFDESLYDEAEHAFRRASEADSQNPDAFLGLAWTANSKHEFAHGATWARRALALDPNLARAHALLGDGAVELGDYDQAYEHYQRALELQPNLSSYSRAAHLLWLTGKSERAQWFMRKAIEAGGAFPENTAWCRAELAMMQFHAGALGPAQQLIARAVKDAPDNPRILTIAGRLAFASGDESRARTLLERAIIIVPQHDSLTALADLAALTNRADELKRYTTEILVLHGAEPHHHRGDPQNHRHHHHHDGSSELARFLADHDRDLMRALAEATRAYKNYPNIYAADTLAWCYYKTGRLEDARRTIHTALEWKTPDASILFHAGMIHAKLCESVQAREYLSRALHLNPRFHPRDAAIAAETLQCLGPATPNDPHDR